MGLINEPVLNQQQPQSTANTPTNDVSLPSPSGGIIQESPLGARPASDKIPNPEEYQPSILRSFLHGIGTAVGTESPEGEEAWQNLPQGPGNNIAEEAGKGTVFGAPFGIAGAISGAASGATSEATNIATSGQHPYLSSGAGLIAGLATAPILGKLAELGIKTARSSLEYFGIAQSPINDLFNGVPRVAGMTSESSMPMENALRSGSGQASTIIRQQEQKTFDVISKRASDIANGLGPDLTQQELGEAVQQTAAQRIAQIRGEVDNMYNALGNVVPKQTQVFPLNTIDALTNIYGKYAGAPALRAQFQQSGIGKYLNAFADDLTGATSGPLLPNSTVMNPNMGLSYDILQNIRTDIGEMIDKGAVNPNVNVKELRYLYSALTKDMESAYTNTNNLHGLRAFQTVNAAAEKSFNDIENLGKLVQSNIEPEMITQRLLAQATKGGTRIDDITSQLNNVDPGVKDMVMGYVLRRLGETTDHNFNPARFYTQWQKLSPEAKDLFPTGQRAGIEKLAQLSGLTANAFENQNVSHTAANTHLLDRIGSAIQGLSTAAFGAAGMAGAHLGIDAGPASMGLFGVGAAGVGFGAGRFAASTLGESMAQRMLARIWTSKAFNTWLGTYAPNMSPDRALVALGSVAGQEPQMASTVNYLINYLSGNQTLQPGEKGRGFLEGGYATLPDTSGNKAFSEQTSGYAFGGYTGFPEQTATAYAGGGPGAQWMNMSEGYAYGGLTDADTYFPTKRPKGYLGGGALFEGNNANLMGYKRGGYMYNPQTNPIAHNTKQADNIITSDMPHKQFADGGFSMHPVSANTNNSPSTPSGWDERGVVMPNQVRPISVLDMFTSKVIPLPANNRAEGGMITPGHDDKPFYNPQLPRVTGGGWGGYYAEGGPAKPNEDTLWIPGPDHFHQNYDYNKGIATPFNQSVLDLFLKSYPQVPIKGHADGGPVDPISPGNTDIARQLKQKIRRIDSLRTENEIDPFLSFERIQNQQKPEQKAQGGYIENSAMGYAEGGITDSIINHVIQIESGGNPNARAKTSSASGLGQFIDSTWRNVMAKYHPEISNSMAVKNDPKLQVEMLGKILGEGKAYLEAHGLGATPGAIYLTHFLGPAGAVKVLSSDPNTPMRALFSAKVVAANPHLNNMTARDLVNLVDRKMNGEATNFIAEASNTTAPSSSPSILDHAMNALSGNEEDEAQNEEPDTNEQLRGALTENAEPATKTAIEAILGKGQNGTA